MKRFLALFPLLALITAGAALAKDDKLDTPPAGVLPTGATISQILKQYDAAAGRLAAGVDDTRREVWHFSKAGLAGTETLTRSGLDFRSKIVAGPVVDEYGQFLDHRWHKDPNGNVSPMEGADVTSFEMQIFTANFNDPEDPKNDIKLLGEVSDPQPAYVIQVKRPDYKHPEWIFYDKKTGLIDQVIDSADGKRYTITYGDYRATKGLTQPWHLHVSDGRTPLDDDFTRESLALGVPTDPRDFVNPASTSSIASYSGHVEIPAKVLFDNFDMMISLNRYQTFSSPTVVVRVTINGRGLDFELASGSPESYIDWDVAQQLNLPSYGQATRAPNGDQVAYDTIVPVVDIGGLKLHNFAMYALPFSYHMGGETKVVGTLGYDVLKSGVFKIDYANGRVTLDPATAFDGPSPVTGAFTIPIHFDQGYPFLEGMLDQHISQNILMDNSFELSFVFGNFTTKYPDSVKDANTGRQHGTTIVPFADSGGYGREVDTWMGNIPDIQFGLAHFVNYQMMGTDGDVDFSGHEVDAVIGADFLKYYDVYLDYPHNRVLLKPNQLFYDHFKAG